MRHRLLAMMLLAPSLAVATRASAQADAQNPPLYSIRVTGEAREQVPPDLGCDDARGYS